MSFELKNLPKRVDRAFSEPTRNGTATTAKSHQDLLTPSAS
jgi:hypothetical protein